MKVSSNYIVSICTLGIIVLLSLLVSGCGSIQQSNQNDSNNTTNNISDSLISIEYSPMQCDTTPWADWLANSNIRFIRAPSEQEVITMFYGQEKYNITLSNLTIIKTSDITCDACSVCSKGYNIDALVKEKDIQIMQDTGWKRLF